MSEDKSTNPAAGAGDPSQAAASPMLVHAQYIKDLSFENPNAPLTLQANAQPPNVQVQIDVKSRPIKDRLMEIALDLGVEARQQDQVVFLVELSYAGLFEITAAAGNLAEQYAGIEAPHYLFPFARAVIADVTRDGGYPPLLINPVDFGRLYQQRKANATAPADQPVPPADAGGSAEQGTPS